jgi:hypothetical protein
MKERLCSHSSGELLMTKVITNRGSKKLEMEVKRLHDDVMTLKTAIEEAIIKGQKSLDNLNDIPEPCLVSNEDFALARTNAGSRTAGWD